MNQLQMLQEEQALEAQLFGTPEVAVTTAPEAPIETEVPEVVPAVEVVVATETVQPTEVSTETQEKEEDWKLRFTNLRNSRDSKLYEAQTALATSQSTVALLQHKVQELLSRKPEAQVDPFKDVFTEEEREALGETAINAMQKTASIAAEARTASITKELADARADALAQAQANATTSATTAYQTFTNRLASIVPNFEEVNLDPRFAEYISAPDIDGSPRSASFLAAEGRGDVANVARYFQDFISKENPKAQAKASLDTKVNPTGVAVTQAASTTNETNGDLTMTEINAHYKRHALGKYAGKQSEYLAMEAKIDAAALARRIKR